MGHGPVVTNASRFAAGMPARFDRRARRSAPFPSGDSRRGREFHGFPMLQSGAAGPFGCVIPATTQGGDA
jgi:hypothetical protein